MESEKKIPTVKNAASGVYDMTTLLQANEGTAIAERPEMGRVVLATHPTRDDLGAKLIREHPVIVWHGEDWRELLVKFQSLSPSLQCAILDMFHPPLTSKPMLRLRASVERLSRLNIIDDIEVIHKLVAIVETNGHQYYGNPDIEYAEVFGIPGTKATKLDALFIYASKVAHSCVPNVTYTSKTQDGCLEYKLIRPVQEGDLVTFSYLGKLFSTPTHLRRKQLLQTKSFVCKCNRCTGPDHCRLLHCPGCEEFMSCIDPGDVTSTLAWHCPECGRIDDEKTVAETDKESKIELELEALKMQSMWSLSRNSISSAKALVAKASARLSPAHYLVLRTIDHCATLCASLAAQGEHMAMMNLGSPLETERLRLQGAEWGFLFVSACECVAAGCNRKRCSVNDVEAHRPLYECTTELFHACQDLKHVPSRQWPDYAPSMIKRYLPLMRICFGAEDSDVGNIEERFVSKTASSSTTSQTKTNTRSGKKNRKKRRGKK